MSKKVHSSSGVELPSINPNAIVEEDEAKQISRSNSISRQSQQSDNGGGGSKRNSIAAKLSGMFGGSRPNGDTKKKNGSTSLQSANNAYANSYEDGAIVPVTDGTATPSSKGGHQRKPSGATRLGQKFNFGNGTESGSQTPRDGGGGGGIPASQTVGYDDYSAIDEDEEYEDEDYESSEEEFEQMEAVITCMAVHPLEPIVAVGCSPDIIKIWNIKAHKFDAGNQHSGRITALAWNADGHLLVSAASWESPVVGWTHSMRLWNLDPKTHAITPPVGFVGQEDLELFDDSIGGPPVPNIPRLTGNAIRLALQNAQRQADMKACNLNTAIALGFISQGIMDGKATTEDLLGSSGAPPLQMLHQDPITCVSFMPLDDNPCIKLLDEHGIGGTVIYASGSQDRTVRIWCYDKSNDATVHVLREHQAEVTCVGWSPDGFMLMSGSLDGTLICWRVSLEPVYETPRGTGTGAGLIVKGDVSVDDDDAPAGRMISCVPIIVQNLKFECYSNSPKPSLEPVYCLQFFPTIHTFGRYPEYTVAVGTGSSLILLRAQALRVHESPLTNIPEFLRVCRRLNKHHRIVKVNKKLAALTASIDEIENDPDDEKAKKALTRKQRDKMLKSREAEESGARQASSKNLGLRPNYLQLSELHRQPIDLARYGAIRSLAVEIHPLERHVAYDLEDSLDSKHIKRNLLSVKEKHVKILLTNHENQGHTLAWVLNEDINPRTQLPLIIPHFCVLGKQNRSTLIDDQSAVIPNGMAYEEHEEAFGGNFIGNYCEQVVIPSIPLRKRFDKYGLQREGSSQIMCFTLNCNKLDPLNNGGHIPEGQSTFHGNGVWSLKFNIEASVDFPGDLEPTISSKVAYDTVKAEMEDRKRKSGQPSSSSSVLIDRLKPKGNEDPDFVGHLANGYEIEFDLPAFVGMLHPMGTTMNEAMRLAEHQRVMGIHTIRYPMARKVFQDAPATTATTVAVSSKNKRVLSTADASSFATADIDSSASATAARNESFLREKASSSFTTDVDDGFIGSNGGDPGLVSSSHLFGAEDEAAGLVIGKKKQASSIRYKQGSESDAYGTSLTAAASSRAKKKAAAAAARNRKTIQEEEDDEIVESSSSSSEDYSSSSSEEDEISSNVQWQSTSTSAVSYTKRSTSSQPGGSGANKKGAPVVVSKLAQFSAQAAIDLAPKQKESDSLFDGMGSSTTTGGRESSRKEGETKGGSSTTSGSNNRAQCATPGECTIQ